MFFYDEDRKILNDLARNYDSLLNKFLEYNNEVQNLIDLLNSKNIHYCVTPTQKPECKESCSKQVAKKKKTKKDQSSV